MDVAGTAFQKVREEEIEPYVNALPIADLRDLENISLPAWRARLKEGWKGEFVRVPGGPFLRDRFFVRANDASMEPLVPNGALCEFRIPSDESPENKVVLAGLKTYAKRTPSVVMRRYQRLSVIQAGEVAETTKIFLTSENRTYPSLELREGMDSIEILGEFEKLT